MVTARRRQNGKARTSQAPRRGQSTNAIGVFDSGIGGLTVVQALLERLPHEMFLYLGDTARYPYGTKSADVVRRYAIENAEFLMERGVKALVVACNTMSAVALATLQDRYDVPIIGVIDPGAQAAAAATRNRKVGVVATEATVRSGEYTRALQKQRKDLEIFTRACPLFVPLAEEGWVDNEVTRNTARLYLGSLRHSGIDTLILGCTHYPLLAGAIQQALGDGVRLVDSASTTAAVVADVLRHANLLRRRGPGGASFFVTDAPERFVKVGSRFLGSQVDSAVRLER